MPASPLLELDELHRLIEMGGAHLAARTMGHVQAGPRELPLIAVTLGNPSPDVPAVGFFGGIHGLERIGAEVALAYLGNLVHRLKWDSVLHAMLERLRIVFMPLVNPGYLAVKTRMQ